MGEDLYKEYHCIECNNEGVLDDGSFCDCSEGLFDSEEVLSHE